MSAQKRPLTFALQLIEQGRYQDARVVLAGMSDRQTAPAWLTRFSGFGRSRVQPKVASLESPTIVPRADNGRTLRDEINTTSQELSLLNEAIKQAEAQQHPNDWLMALGFFLLPFGVGALVLAYAVTAPRRNRQRLDRLQDKRRRLLKDIEARYSQSVAGSDTVAF